MISNKMVWMIQLIIQQILKWRNEVIMFVWNLKEFH